MKHKLTALVMATTALNFGTVLNAQDNQWGLVYENAITENVPEMTWDATDQIELINVPLLMMAGNKADTFYMTSDAFEKATGTTDKELFLIPGATHIKTYYVPEYVDQEVAKLTEFFGSKL